MPYKGRLTRIARPKGLGPGVEVAHALGGTKAGGVAGAAEVAEDGPLERGEAAAGLAQAGQRADGAHARRVYRMIAPLDLRRFALSTPSRVTWQSLQHQ